MNRNWFLREVSINFHFYRAECIRMTKHSPFNIYHNVCIVQCTYNCEIEKYSMHFKFYSEILKLWISAEQINPNSIKLGRRLEAENRYLIMCANFSHQFFWGFSYKILRIIIFIIQNWVFYRSKYTTFMYTVRMSLIGMKFVIIEH